jgi:hypothetical protein
MSEATHFSFDPAEFAGKRALATGGTGPPRFTAVNT